MTDKIKLNPKDYGLKIPKDAELLPATRLYRGKFPYALSIRRITKPSKDNNFSGSRTWYSFRTVYAESLKELKANIKIIDGEERQTSRYYTFTETVMRIFIPTDENHLNIISSKENEVTNIVRDKYFLNQFEYQWILNKEIPEEARNNLRKLYPELVFSSRKIFANHAASDEENIVFQMNDLKIKKIEYVILTEELKCH